MHDPLDLADKEIDDIIAALGIWANDLLGWEAAELQEGNQGEAVAARKFRGRIERLLAKLVAAQRRS